MITWWIKPENPKTTFSELENHILLKGIQYTLEGHCNYGLLLRWKKTCKKPATQRWGISFINNRWSWYSFLTAPCFSRAASHIQHTESTCWEEKQSYLASRSIDCESLSCSFWKHSLKAACPLPPEWAIHCVRISLAQLREKKIQTKWAYQNAGTFTVWEK